MRAWLWTIILLVAAVALALLLREHSGNVYILLPPDTRIVYSLNFAVISLVVAFIVLYVLLRFLGWISNSPERFQLWRGRRAQRRDRRLLESGWLNVLEGRYDKAEKDLSKLLAKTRVVSSKVLAAIAVARAANDQGDIRRRDEALALAKTAAKSDDRLNTAIDTANAGMVLELGDAAQAIALLEPLQDANSRAFHTTRMLLRANRMLGRHDRVYDLTRLLLRRSAIGRDEALAILSEAAAARITAGGAEEFKALWGDLRSEEKVLPNVAAAAAQVKQQSEEYQEEGRILEAALNRQLDDTLLYSYANCPSEFYARRLSKAEEWLKREPHNATLLAVLGQLCITGELWGQAEHYLKRSMKVRNDVRVHALLGNLYDALGRTDDAVRHWRLAASVLGTLPAISLRRTLPVADTTADPDPTLVDGGYDSEVSFVSSNTVPPMMAASAAADYEHEVAETGRATVSSATASTASTTHVEHEDYFDTAPPVGVDHSIISDQPARRGN